MLQTHMEAVAHPELLFKEADGGYNVTFFVILSFKEGQGFFFLSGMSLLWSLDLITWLLIVFKRINNTFSQSNEATNPKSPCVSTPP